jgi:hypothetical protein
MDPLLERSLIGTLTIGIFSLLWYLWRVGTYKADLPEDEIWRPGYGPKGQKDAERRRATDPGPE